MRKLPYLPYPYGYNFNSTIKTFPNEADGIEQVVKDIGNQIRIKCATGSRFALIYFYDEQPIPGGIEAGTLYDELTEKGDWTRACKKYLGCKSIDAKCGQCFITHDCDESALLSSKCRHC